MRAALARWRPEHVVISPWDPLNGLSDLLAGCRIWVMAHGRDITATLDPERQEQRARLFGAPVDWLCLTGWLEGHLRSRGVSAERIHRLPAAVCADPVTAARRSPRSSLDGAHPIQLLTVGRLIARKGHDVVLKALVDPRCSELSYRIVGEGPCERRLRRLARRLGVDKRVVFEGRLSAEGLAQVWTEADVFVLPARTENRGDTEGFGLVYLEAGLYSLPVIGSREGGVGEAVVHQETGLCMEDPTDPAELAGLLTHLAADSTLRRALGEAGRRRVVEGGLPQHLGAALMEILASSSPRPPLEEMPHPFRGVVGPEAGFGRGAS